MIESIDMEPLPSSQDSPKKGFLKFTIAFLAIILLGYVTFVVAFNIRHWDEIRANQQTEKDVEAWLDVYRNDKAGGATPDETVELFIAALEKNDVELATSYFMPDDKGSRDEERAMIQETFDGGYFPELADAMKNRRVNQDGVIGDKFYSFFFDDDAGELAGGIFMQFNGNVWKIEHF
jgi:hypothetical protein